MYKFYAGRAERSDLLDGGKGARTGDMWGWMLMGVVIADVGGRRAPGAAAGNDEYLDAAKARALLLRRAVASRCARAR